MEKFSKCPLSDAPWPPPDERAKIFLMHPHEDQLDHQVTCWKDYHSFLELTWCSFLTHWQDLVPGNADLIHVLYPFPTIASAVSAILFFSLFHLKLLQVTLRWMLKDICEASKWIDSRHFLCDAFVTHSVPKDWKMWKLQGDGSMHPIVNKI